MRNCPQPADIISMAHHLHVWLQFVYIILIVLLCIQTYFVLQETWIHWRFFFGEQCCGWCDGVLQCCIFLCWSETFTLVFAYFQNILQQVFSLLFKLSNKRFGFLWIAMAQSVVKAEQWTSSCRILIWFSQASIWVTDQNCCCAAENNFIVYTLA